MAIITEDLLKAIVRLRNENDFRIFETWLSQHYKDSLLELEMQNELAQIYRAQGACKKLKSILENMQTAKDILDKAVKGRL